MEFKYFPLLERISVHCIHDIVLNTGYRRFEVAGRKYIPHHVRNYAGQ
jgi:hypothetical protein